MTRVHNFSLATRHSSLATFFLLLFTALPTSAQGPTTGTPAFGSFGGGPDTINLANLNVHWTVPVIHKPGRGTNFNYDLTYDSSVWYPVGPSGSQSWQSVSNWGWTSNSAFASGNNGYITYTQTTTYCYDGQGHPNGAEQYISNSIYYDPWGTAHHFSGYVDVKYGGCGNSQVNTYPGGTSDGSGLIINNPPGPVITPGGTSLSPPVNPNRGAYASTVTDRNGNQVTADTSGNFFDTLSSTTPALTVSGVVPNPVSFTYTAPSGASAVYTMKYTTLSIQTNFGCSGITEYGTNGTTTANLVTEIDLPDWNASTNPNAKYTFSYEPTPNHSGFVTGRLKAVTLPTGGTISYTYTAGNLTGSAVGSHDPIVCADGSTAGLQRSTPDTGTNYWNYARTQVSGNHWQTKVTTSPDTANSGSVGDDTVIDFQKDSASPSTNFYETQRVAYQGSSSGTVLRTVTTCYNTNTASCATTAVSSPIDLPPSSAHRIIRHRTLLNS